MLNILSCETAGSEANRKTIAIKVILIGETLIMRLFVIIEVKGLVFDILNDQIYNFESNSQPV